MGQSVDSRHRPKWTKMPRLWWLVGIVILLIIGLIGLVSLVTPNDSEPGRKYVPPAMVDGEIVPGHFE
jgi:hypothetical protein